jgi:hypothetical protein
MAMISAWCTTRSMSGGARRVGKDGRPFGEREVRRKDEALAFVAPADDLEQQVGVPRVVVHVANLIDAQEL